MRQTLLWTEAGRQGKGRRTVRVSPGTLRQRCTKIWGTPGCLPLVAQPDTTTSGNIAYSSARRGVRQRSSQDSRKPSSISAAVRFSPREGGTQRLVGRRAGNRHWRASLHVRPCYDAEARLSFGLFELHGTDSWPKEANTVGVAGWCCYLAV